MLKFTISSEDNTRKLYCLGLSRGNIDRLTKGDPVLVNLNDLGDPDLRIALVFGETELDIFDDCKKNGLIPQGVEFKEATAEMTEVVRVKHLSRRGEKAMDTILAKYPNATATSWDDDGSTRWYVKTDPAASSPIGRGDTESIAWKRALIYLEQFRRI